MTTATARLKKKANAKAIERFATALKAHAKTMVIRIDTIVALRAEGDYASVVVEKMPSILTGQSLGRIEAMLPTARFIWLSRSLMINVAQLREIETIDRDATRIHLHGCSESFLIGRHRRRHLRAGAIPAAFGPHRRAARPHPDLVHGAGGGGAGWAQDRGDSGLRCRSKVAPSGSEVPDPARVRA